MVMTGPAAETAANIPAPGQARRTGRGHIDSFGQGRICAAPECITKLSRYNPSAVCALHDQATVSVTHWTR